MKQKVIIYGEKVEKNYYFGEHFYEINHVKTFYKHIDWQEIYNGEVDDPPFFINDNVFIPELNKSIKITKNARNIDGGYVYWTDYIVDENENIESKEKAEKEYNGYLELVEKQTKKLIEDSKEKPKKRWFRLRKGDE